MPKWLVGWEMVKSEHLADDRVTTFEKGGKSEAIRFGVDSALWLA